MTVNAPLCTVAIPVYHRRDKSLAVGAIESALAQTRDDIEILVIDDCTTDGTWHLLRQISDPRARVLRNERNVGLFGNFNRCLDEAHGQFVRILCSDDVLERGTLDDELAIMRSHPDMALLTTRGLRVSPRGQVLGLQAAALPAGVYRGENGIAAVLRASLATGYNALNYPSGILMRRSCVDAVGRFRTNMRVVGDMDYFLRLLRVGTLGVVDRIGCRVTVHEDQVGYQLSLDPSTMQDQFTLLDAFADCLGDDRTRRDVRRCAAALSLWQALRSTLAGDVANARAHLEVARRNGAANWQMVDAFARLVGRRVWWKLRGPFVPGGAVPDVPLAEPAGIKPLVRQNATAGVAVPSRDAAGR
jgi:glycosyltransferase involved in cell wall biosynthesis